MAEALEKLDDRFVQIYETARAERVAHEQRKGLIVVKDDVMLLYRGDEPVRQFTGLEPPLYNKMKTLGHIPLAVFCLLHATSDGALSLYAPIAVTGAAELVGLAGISQSGSGAGVTAGRLSLEAAFGPITLDGAGNAFALGDVSAPAGITLRTDGALAAIRASVLDELQEAHVI